MKIIYDGHEVGLTKTITKVIDILGEESIRTSPNHIIACKCNNSVKPLDYDIKDGDTVELIDLSMDDGIRVYIRGALFIMGQAFSELYSDLDIFVDFQLSNAMFCEIKNAEVTDEIINNVKKRMQEIIDKDLPIKKIVMSKDEAREFYKNHKSQNGSLQLENDDKSEVCIYSCNDYYNYFYGVMPLSTGYINIFDLQKYKNGFIVRYPNKSNPKELGEFKESKKFLAKLQEYDQIYKLMKVSTIQELNNEVRNGRSKELILTCEALQEKKIAELAEKIASQNGVKMVLIAGPSSSSKTTFAKKLGLQLKIKGLRPVTIGTDDYFVERDQTPRDENGEYDFETIDALDLDLFNDHLTRLINGETVNIPTFDFKTGTKHYYDDKKLHLENDQILIIEGIHCLNDKLTAKIPKENKFKIYISDLTVLNIDNFNRISTTDTRLIRRIVRDYNFRGYSAKETISRWPSVNRGENKNIFPYQEEADAMFNSSMVYELGVLAKYAKKLLREIKNDEPEYSEARRIITFLEYFEEIDETPIPNNSLLREFIGGSVFDY